MSSPDKNNPICIFNFFSSFFFKYPIFLLKIDLFILITFINQTQTMYRPSSLVPTLPPGREPVPVPLWWLKRKPKPKPKYQ